MSQPVEQAAAPTQRRADARAEVRGLPLPLPLPHLRDIDLLRARLDLFNLRLGPAMTHGRLEARAGRPIHEDEAHGGQVVGVHAQLLHSLHGSLLLAQHQGLEQGGKGAPEVSACAPVHAVVDHHHLPRARRIGRAVCVRATAHHDVAWV